uniref:Phosphodiesterase n=2 Tax=Hemiselmis andersenii TaxID=464988 RepID=A0A6T8NKG2_HEMAN|mmetsp:Transcript_3053/g.6998  ORF Transcript_3053/g.6998 Transcript_3053/m.6998 type:complete len:569 (-) Transcript_3053:305-2011(-)
MLKATAVAFLGGVGVGYGVWALMNEGKRKIGADGVQSPRAGAGSSKGQLSLPPAKRRSLDMGLVGALASPRNSAPAPETPTKSPGGGIKGSPRVARSSSTAPTNPFIDELVKQNMSPAEVAESVAAKLLETLPLSDEDRVSLSYVRCVLHDLCLDSTMSHVPALLQGSHSLQMEDVDPDTVRYLRSNFTPVDSVRKAKSVKSLKSVTKGMRFALRLQRTSTSKMVSSGYDLPYQVSQEDMQRISSVLEKCDKWDFDVFELKEATANRELRTMAWHLLQRYDLFQKFSLDKAKMMAWLSYVEDLYCDTPYHNHTHATDVLQTVNFFLSTAGASEYLSEIHILALILAAVVHDVGHDGLNNTFHKNAMTERAIFFNDQSIQENFHVSTIFSATLNNDEINWLSQMAPAQSTEIRRMVISMVLGTDMTTHFTHLKEFKSTFDQAGNDASEWEAHVDVLLVQILHTADISNPAKPLGKAKEWAGRVLEEYFVQGDKEKEMRLSVSPMCNRDTTVMAQTQIGFIKVIVHPTFELVGQLLPEVRKTCVTMLEDNLEYWQEQTAQQSQKPAGSAD